MVGRPIKKRKIFSRPLQHVLEYIVHG
jgi:hypothetical protein